MGQITNINLCISTKISSRCQLLKNELTCMLGDVNYFFSRVLSVSPKMSTTQEGICVHAWRCQLLLLEECIRAPRCQLFLERIYKHTKISTSLERNCIRDMQEACKAYALTNNQCLCMLVPLYKLSLYINGMPVCDIV